MIQREKAISYLKRGIEQGIWKPGDRLPPLRVLGKDAGVSAPTISKAVNFLSQQGLLSIHPRSRITIPYPKGFVLPTPIKHEEKWELIRTKIANDLLAGVLDSYGPLPTIQELCYRYSTSYPILKKVLNSLEKDGLLTVHKRGYKPTMFDVSNPTAKILVLVPILSDKINKNAINFLEKGFVISGRGFAFIHKLEQMCKIQNLDAEIWGYYLKAGSVTYIKPDLSSCNSIDKSKSYYGICLIKNLPLSTDFSRMLLQLSKLDIPISILEVTGEAGYSLPPTKKTNIRVFPIGATDLASQKIGRHLLDSGHRNIAFISAWQRVLWSKNRYDGLCKVFSMSKGSRVHLFADTRFMSGFIHLDDRTLDENFNNFPSLDKLIKPYNILPDEQAKYLAYEMDEFIHTAIGDQRLGIFMEPLFKQALLRSDITAWVCADDIMALSAMRFLRKNNIDIPGRISVVGFEDIPQAFRASLTTYNYDVQGITQTMLAFISNQDLFPAKQGLFIEKNGFLVQRQSSGPARI